MQQSEKLIHISVIVWDGNSWEYVSTRFEYYNIISLYCEPVNFDGHGATGVVCLQEKRRMVGEFVVLKSCVNYQGL